MLHMRSIPMRRSRIPFSRGLDLELRTLIRARVYLNFNNMVSKVITTANVTPHVMDSLITFIKS
jgi:hypothetical protein